MTNEEQLWTLRRIPDKHAVNYVNDLVSRLRAEVLCWYDAVREGRYIMRPYNGGIVSRDTARTLPTLVEEAHILLSHCQPGLLYTLCERYPRFVWACTMYLKKENVATLEENTAAARLNALLYKATLDALEAWVNAVLPGQGILAHMANTQEKRLALLHHLNFGVANGNPPPQLAP